MFQKKIAPGEAQEELSKSHILYTNNYQFTTSRRFANECKFTCEYTTRDKYLVRTELMECIGPKKNKIKYFIKYKYFKYDYISFYNKAFGVK